MTLGKRSEFKSLGKRIWGCRRMPDQAANKSQKGASISILAMACLLFIFGVVAQNVAEGKSFAFDRSILVALREPGNPSVPIGPAWVQEAARDLTSLGSIIVLVIITFAVAGYLFLARKYAATWLMLVAVFGGIALSDLLKFAFARTRPDFVSPAARVFTTSFPSGHAALSAITYLTIAALLAKPIIIQDWSLLHCLGGASDDPYRHQPHLSWGSLSDRFAGWSIGTAWALGCWVLMTWLQQGGRVESTGPM